MRAVFVNPPLPGLEGLVRDLIYGCWCGGRRVGGIEFPPVPLALMATLLRREGIPAAIVDAPAEGLSESDVAARLSPGDLLFCVSSPLSAEIDVPFLERMRSRSGVRTVLLGAFPTFRPADALARDAVDYIVRGEPELAVAGLCRTLAAGEKDSGNIPGVGRKEDGEVVLPETVGVPPDLDSLPIPDRGLLPDSRRYFNPVVRHRRFTTMFTSRGCFGRCTFCSSPGFFGGKARYRSAESVLSELCAVRDEGYREVFFRDELFTGDRRRLFTLCSEIPRRGIRVGWVCSTRVDRIDEDAAMAMKAAGCHLVRMGVESGSQPVLDRIRKGITVADTVAAFAACRKAGLSTHAHTMVGLPGETAADFGETIRLVREIRPTYLTMSICTPFPGTALYRELERTGEIPSSSYLGRNALHGLYSAPVHNHLFSGIPSAELERCLKTAYREFYLNWGYVGRQLLSIGSPGELFRKARTAARIVAMVSARG